MPPRPVIVITGASSGIGKATALRFGREGYRVVLADYREQRLRAVAQEVQRLGGEPLAVPTDVSVWAQVQALAEETQRAFGQVDVLFNNAGFGRFGWVEALDPQQDIEAQVRVDLLGLIWVTRAFLPMMLAQRQGHIINMGSIASLMATPMYAIYNAAKFGVRGFTEALRREVEVMGLRVSLLCPGTVKTEFGRHTQDPRRSGVTMPPWLVLRPEEVAQAVWDLVQRPRRVRVFPWLLRPVVWVGNLLPGLTDALIRWGFTRRERGLR